MSLLDATRHILRSVPSIDVVRLLEILRGWGHECTKSELRRLIREHRLRTWRT